MLYFLLVLLNFGSPQLPQTNSFVGNWQIIEFRDIETNEVTEKIENLTMQIFSNGNVIVTEEGEEENGKIVLEGNDYFLITEEGTEKQKVIIRYEGDKMFWQYDGEIIVFIRLK